MKRCLSLGFLVVLGSFTVIGQSADEAIRYSQLSIAGTARGMGVAGAFGAIGADFTSIISNPAGLAMFRRSELMLTPGLMQIKTKSDYLSNRSEDEKFNFNLGNIGGVVSMVYEDSRGNRSKGKWVAANFGFGYNRMANFHSNKFYSAANTTNSVLTGYKNELNGTPPDQIEYGANSFESVLAYDSYLVNPKANNPSNYSAATDNGVVDQTISLQSTGALSELSFSMAGNYDNKLYFGGYIGIPFLWYKERITYSETDRLDTIPYFNSFELNQQLNTFGVGVNFKMGVIYRATNWLRLGVALHTPTRFGMEDNFYSDVRSDFDTMNHSIQSPDGKFDYKLKTPMRFVGSIGLVMKKYGFISFDYEWVDYGNAKYLMTGQYKTFQQTINGDIAGIYSTAHVFRLGSELAYEFFRIRGGFANYGTPFKNTSEMGDADDTRRSYTFGIGVRKNNVFVDFAYVRDKFKSTNLVSAVTTVDETIRNNYVLTVGFRFR